MGNIEFAWDTRKAVINIAKHGVSFDEARTAFFDEYARLIDDPDHSAEEDRFVLVATASGRDAFWSATAAGNPAR